MNVRIITGDCREVLFTLDRASVDLVIADPPYNETSLTWDVWPSGWLDAVAHVLKPTGSLWVFGSLRMFMDRAAEFRAAGWKLAQDVIWEKHNGSNAFADRFRRVHEQPAQFYHGDWASVFKSPLFSTDATARSVRRKTTPQQWGDIGKSFYESFDGGPRMMRSVWCARSEHGVALHPTQKPLSIIVPLIEYSSPAGAVILDPMAGSGTTGIAAKITGRSSILVEIDPAYIEIATTRVAKDAPLFAAAAE